MILAGHVPFVEKDFYFEQVPPTDVPPAFGFHFCFARCRLAICGSGYVVKLLRAYIIPFLVVAQKAIQLLRLTAHLVLLAAGRANYTDVYGVE